MDLIERLARDPRSEYRANQLDDCKPGGFLYWDRTCEMLADLHDQIQAVGNLLAVHGSKKRPRKIKPYPRPVRRRSPATNLDSVDYTFFKL